MSVIPTTLSKPIARLGSAAQNALEVARFGGLETGDASAPFEISARDRVYRLRHYFPDNPAPGPPVMLVPPLMLAANVYDISLHSSGVRSLHTRDVDPWVVDFGAPEREEGGFERTLTDHVVAVANAIGQVRSQTGRDVHIAGYSQGGMFCYQAAAYLRGDGLASVITFGTPIDAGRAFPAIPQEVLERVAAVLASILGRTNVSPAVARVGFRLINPVKTLRNEVNFLLQLHDREVLLPREAQRRFLAGEGWVGWPGPAVGELMSQFIATNRMLEGGFVIEDRVLTLADVALPVLSGFGEIDHLAPGHAIRATPQAMPLADLYEFSVPAGHFGLVVGSHAERTTWPTVAAWTHWCEDGDRLPEGIAPSGHLVVSSPPASHGLDTVLGTAAGVGVGVARLLGNTLLQTARAVHGLAAESVEQLPRLARLQRVRPGTAISLGRLLDERAQAATDDVFLLFADRAITYGAINSRIDALVRGLLQIGVHQGEHIGVLMNTRPSGISTVAALSRVGAVAVLMRPDGDTRREARLGEVKLIVAEPELTVEALKAGVPVYAAGGGQPRTLDSRVDDMEHIDPSKVKLPAWYQPNPGRARDPAFILFAGQGPSTRRSRITNGRWALSAFGTASAAALRHTDTVYAVTPIFHPSGLLMTVGGAITAGARIALTRHFDPGTFWEEVRRYGVTVSSYTWTMLNEIANAPHNAAERDHPVRLFMGAGMPRGLWRRVGHRFATAGVLEFYASTEGSVILANLTGHKPGCKGRPLPGSSEIRLAAYDLKRGRLHQGADGYAVECGAGEVGMLLSRTGDATSVVESPRRSVFARNDAWQETGDLFRRDADGDHWLVGTVSALIPTQQGLVANLQLEEALSDVEAVDLAVVYPIANEHGRETSRVVAAVTLRPGHELDAAALQRELMQLPSDQWPDAVQVVRRIPVTTWYRPTAPTMRRNGFPKPGPHVWFRHGDSYRQD